MFEKNIQRCDNLQINIISAFSLTFLLTICLVFADSLRIHTLENKSAHFWLELVGVLLATLAGLAAVRQLKLTGSSFYMFIGLAFFINGIVDIIHSFASIDFFGKPTSGQSVFIPATWTVGRMFLAIFFFLALFKRPSHIHRQNSSEIFIIHLAPASLLLLAFTTIILLFPIPKFILPEAPHFLHRPYELLAIVPLFVALLFYFKRLRLMGLNGTLLLLSFISGIFAGVFMMESTDIFDAHFNLAHILKNLSYFAFALSFIAKDIGEETFASEYRLSFGWGLFLGFASITIVTIILLITVFAIKGEYVIHEINRYLVLLSIVTLFFTLFYPLRLFRNFNISLKDLSNTVEAISKGDLNVEINPKIKSLQNEVGDLSMAFDRILVSLKLAMKMTAPELKKEKEKLQQEVRERNAILDGINMVLREALKSKSYEETGLKCLQVAEKITESRFGFIGELNSKGAFDTIAISNPGWEKCNVPRGEASFIIRNMPVRGVDRATMMEGKSRIVNGEEAIRNHPDHVELPVGHPPLTSFMGVPLKYEDKTVGMIGLANKEGGYSMNDQEAIESLSVVLLEALKLRKNGD